MSEEQLVDYMIGSYMCKMTADHANQWNNSEVCGDSLAGARICLGGHWVDLWGAIDDSGQDTKLFQEICDLAARQVVNECEICDMLSRD